MEYDITEIYNYCLDNNSVYFPEELFNKVFGSSEQFLEDEKSTVYLKLQIDNALYFRGPCGSMNIHQEGFSLSFKGFNNYFAQELIMINIGFEMSKSNIVYELITTLGSTSMERIKQSINGNK